MPKKILNLDAAILHNLQYLPSCLRLDKTVLPGFLLGEYAFARYNNTETDYFLITNRAIRQFSDNNETIMLYENILSVDIPVMHTYPLTGVNPKKRLVNDPQQRYIEIKVQPEKTILLSALHDPGDVFALRSFIHQTICRYSRFRDPDSSRDLTISED